MPEANVLYSVTAAVVLGLVTWVAVVLKTAKEPWARELPQAAKLDDDVPIEKVEKVIVAEPAAENAMTSEGAPASEKAEAKAEAEAEAEAKAEADDAKAKADADAKAKADDAKV